jgi:chromosome segregation ATPase
MLTDKQIQALRSENELLQIQLEDVNMVIEVREEELELLRNRAMEAAAMQSKLDNNLNEFDQMQRSLGDIQQKNSGNIERLEEMENELYDSVKEQIKYADSLKEFNSVEANLLDTTNELHEAASVYRRMAEMKTQLAASQSNLEIAMMEIESLKEELAEIKAYNALLLQKKMGSND